MIKISNKFKPKKTFNNLLKEKGTTSYKLAKECGMSQTAIYKITRGETDIINSSLGIIYIISNALNMTVDEMINYLYHFNSYLDKAKPLIDLLGENIEYDSISELYFNDKFNNIAFNNRLVLAWIDMNKDDCEEDYADTEYSIDIKLRGYINTDIMDVDDNSKLYIYEDTSISMSKENDDLKDYKKAILTVKWNFSNDFGNMMIDIPYENISITKDNKTIGNAIIFCIDDSY